MLLKVLSPPLFLSLDCLAGIFFLVAALAGCSLPRFFKSDDPKKSIGTTLRHDPKSGQLTQDGLQAEVMSFADEYVLTIRQAMFYVERVPRLLTLQGELLAGQVTTNPEVQGLVNNADKAVDNFAALVSYRLTTRRWPDSGRV